MFLSQRVSIEFISEFYYLFSFYFKALLKCDWQICTYLKSTIRCIFTYLYPHEIIIFCYYEDTLCALFLSSPSTWCNQCHPLLPAPGMCSCNHSSSFSSGINFLFLYSPPLAAPDFPKQFSIVIISDFSPAFLSWIQSN